MKKIFLLLCTALLLWACGGKKDATIAEVKTYALDSVYTLPNDTIAKRYLDLLSGYSRVRQALVSANAQRAQQEADTLLAAVNRLLVAVPRDTSVVAETLRKRANNVRAVAVAVQQSGLLAEQRNHFYGLSQMLDQLIRDFGTGGQPWQQYTAPGAIDHKPAYWLQPATSDTTTLQDPYGTPNGAVAALTAAYGKP